MRTTTYDLAVIGGGINGCGIARDAAGRGLSVFLCEQNDLASGTSSASTKLIHGGLRYLEYYEFRLVREALREREVLLTAAPHIIWPLRFILPHHRGLRPAWLIRLGLFLYDHIGGRKLLPKTKKIDLRRDIAGTVLKPGYRLAFEYSDCWVLDSRLVILNAMDGAARGADIRTRCRLLSARRDQGSWLLSLADQTSGAEYQIRARTLVNSSGPWLDQLLNRIDHGHTPEHIRMVKGSHIIVPRLFDHQRAYIFQNSDGRIIFAIPYEEQFTLIGTTDVDYTGAPEEVRISPEETDYLCRAASEYFRAPITPGDVVSSFSGIRPLFDDGSNEAKAATRDYVLKLDGDRDVPVLLSIYGGKITTYRQLAQSVLNRLAPFLPAMGGDWTETTPLPGGDFAPDRFEHEVDRLLEHCPLLDRPLATRLTRCYGTRARGMTERLTNAADRGPAFGHGLYGFEVDYLIRHEWARSAEDILWRRTKLGLLFDSDETAALQAFVDKHPEITAHR
ncbi:MAG: glycerol-3-phosphate dehydrogenase [Desulfofustis sp.]|jgi:glycerol-3-phosphate dehydrogenase|nr:glycerol-3-phosphate dehydrogenase [Desulfofustis sp.]